MFWIIYPYDEINNYQIYHEKQNAYSVHLVKA